MKKLDPKEFYFKVICKKDVSCFKLEVINEQNYSIYGRRLCIEHYNLYNDSGTRLASFANRMELEEILKWFQTRRNFRRRSSICNNCIYYYPISDCDELTICKHKILDEECNSCPYKFQCLTSVRD
jgi:hypothetical protein